MSEQLPEWGSEPEPAPSDAAGAAEAACPQGAAGESSRAVLLPPSETTTSNAAPLPLFDAAGLLARQWAEMDEPVELSAAEVAALPVAWVGPPDVEDVPWWLSNEFLGSDEAEQAAWLRGLPADVAAGWGDEPRSDDLPGAGFSRHDGGIGPRPEAGFAAGGVLDGAAPGPVLAAAVDAAALRGGGLGESELIGVLCAWQRLASWAQAGLAGCVNVLVARRMDQSVELRAAALAEHVDAEVAAALGLTGQAAVRLVGVAGGLGRLPCVLTALGAGRIDWAKAVLLTDGLAGLPDEDAYDIADAVLSTAEGRTTGQLRAVLARAVLAYDPQAARRRRERARKDASVQSWTEGSGNSCLAGRELEPADVIEASARLTEQARWLRGQGAAGSTDELRAAAYVALLTGRSLDSLVPPGSRPGRIGQPDGSGQPDGGGQPDGRGTSDGAGQPAGTGQFDDRGNAASEDAFSGGEPGRDCAAGSGPASSGTEAVAGGRLGGSITLTMPLSAWLGLSDGPGEVSGHGPADAGTCRDLAAATGPGTRWCLTLTGADGRAVAHACASHPPGPGNPGDRAGPVIGWAIELGCKMQFLETGPCSHARRARRYRPPANLVHLIGVRQRTCSFPGCQRPARRCDLDHTVPYDQGGVTCECNLAPLCRRHHQAKQAPGWHLTQDQPGIMTWRTPSGRTYTTLPDPYPV